MKKTRTKIYDPTHPSAIAVEPLRADAVEQAKQHAQKTVDNVAAALAQHGGDRHSLAPYPDSKLNRTEYEEKLSYYRLVHYLTVTASTSEYHSRRLNDPDPVVMSEEQIAKFIEDAERRAELQYTAFIIKLIDKVGKCLSATLEGSHIWGWSVMTVIKEDDITEYWKTHSIINVSKYGYVFNQWPTKKVKQP